MTYGQLKSLCEALLTGDNILPDDDDQVKSLLSYAYNKVATEADALKLFTASKDNAILRQGPGRTFIRVPDLPKDDNDELDVDSELGFPTARYICSFISREKGGIHVMEAQTLIRHYNAKVQAYLESLDQANELEDDIRMTI